MFLMHIIISSLICVYGRIFVGNVYSLKSFIHIPQESPRLTLVSFVFLVKQTFPDEIIDLDRSLRTIVAYPKPDQKIRSTSFKVLLFFSKMLCRCLLYGGNFVIIMFGILMILQFFVIPTYVAVWQCFIFCHGSKLFLLALQDNLIL